MGLANRKNMCYHDVNFQKDISEQEPKKAVKETLASRTSTGRGRHRLRAPSGWTLAHREHSGAGISKDMDMQKAGRVRRGIRQAHVTCLKEWRRFCSKGSRRQVSMRVVPRNITRV